MSLEFDNDVDFASLFETSVGATKKFKNPKIGDKVSGKVIKITDNSVFVDIGIRNEAVIDKVELLDKEGICTVAIGDAVEAFCVGTKGDVSLTTKMSADATDDGLADAHAMGLPVEGKVNAECKGGFEVTVGKTRAFCPYSQINTSRQDASTYIGNTYLFLITEYSEGGRNVLVSRRKLVEKENAEKQKELQESLSDGDIVTGVVTRIMPFGVFVDIGGVEGLIHISELSWSRVQDASGLVSIGQEVEVKIKELNWQNSRISLSLRGALTDPWTTEIYKYTNGAVVKGKITNIADFGLFVELEPGLEGLVHISKLGLGKRVENISAEFTVGDEVEARVASVDQSSRKISLTMEKEVKSNDVAVNTATENTVDVEKIKQIGGKGKFGSASDLFDNIKL